MVQGRSGHSPVVLTNGRVLITGGLGIVPPNTFSASLQSAEIFEPESATFGPAGSMLVPRLQHRTTRLNDGRVLVTGGFGVNSSINSSAELYDATGTSSSATGAMIAARASHFATVLPDGS